MHWAQVWSETKGAGKGWSIVRQGSPGNLESFEDVVFEMGDEAQDTPTAVAVQLALDAAAGWRVGLAYCDNTLKVLGMSEFLDSDQLTNLEAALVRLGAKECVVAEDKVRAPVEGRKLREVLERCDVVLTERKARDFATKDAAQDLGRLLGAESGKALLGAGERPHGLAAAACLIRYLDLLADEALHGARPSAPPRPSSCRPPAPSHLAAAACDRGARRRRALQAAGARAGRVHAARQGGGARAEPAAAAAGREPQHVALRAAQQVQDARRVATADALGEAAAAGPRGDQRAARPRRDLLHGRAAPPGDAGDLPPACPGPRAPRAQAAEAKQGDAHGRLAALPVCAAAPAAPPGARGVRRCARRAARLARDGAAARARGGLQAVRAAGGAVAGPGGHRLARVPHLAALLAGSQGARRAEGGGQGRRRGAARRRRAQARAGRRQGEARAKQGQDLHVPHYAQGREGAALQGRDFPDARDAQGRREVHVARAKAAGGALQAARRRVRRGAGLAGRQGDGDHRVVRPGRRAALRRGRGARRARRRTCARYCPPQARATWCCARRGTRAWR